MVPPRLRLALQPNVSHAAKKFQTAPHSNGEVPASFSLALSGGFNARFVYRLPLSRLAAQPSARLLVLIDALYDMFDGV